MTEAVNAITQYAFDKFKAVRVQICTQLDNKKSVSVAKRCGFIQEAILKNYRLDCLSKKPCDEVIFACFSTAQLSFLTPMTIG
jgi:RimJ/RimL family protein N-acetyltransferase